MTDDYITIRIPRCRGWRTVGVNAAMFFGALAVLPREVAAGVCAVALVNIVLRLANRSPARPCMLGLLRPPGDALITAALAAQVDSVRPLAAVPPSVERYVADTLGGMERPYAADEQQARRDVLAKMVNVMMPPGLSVLAALEVDKRQTAYAKASAA